jgi:hypothetical protein
MRTVLSAVATVLASCEGRDRGGDSRRTRARAGLAARASSHDWRTAVRRDAATADGDDERWEEEEGSAAHSALKVHAGGGALCNSCPAEERRRRFSTRRTGTSGDRKVSVDEEDGEVNHAGSAEVDDGRALRSVLPREGCCTQGVEEEDEEEEKEAAEVESDGEGTCTEEAAAEEAAE